MAQAIADGAQSVEGVEAKVFSLEQSENDFVKASQCVIVGTPTYLASMAGEVKMWLDGQRHDGVFRWWLLWQTVHPSRASGFEGEPREL